MSVLLWLQKPASRLLRTAMLMCLFVVTFGDEEARPVEMQYMYQVRPLDSQHLHFYEAGCNKT
jgi:hypothetical protein